MERIRVTGRDERGDHQLAPDILLLRIQALFGDGNAHEIAGLDAEMFREDRTHDRGVVPRELRDRVGQFLEPPVIDVAPVVHRITANENDLGRIERRRRRRSPKRVRDSARVVGIEGRRFVLERDVRRKTIPQKPGPRGREITRGRGGAKCFLHQFGSFDFRSAQHGVHQVDFRKAAEERKNHRLNRQIRAFESERVPPRFQIMSGGNVPVAQGRSRILIMTEAHNVGHSLLERRANRPAPSSPDPA